jgi:hypothetical protein
VIPVYVTGRALWSPGYPNAASWLAGTRDESATQPQCAVVGSRLKRATSLVTRMGVDVAEQAARDAAADASTVATVFGSATGEIHIAMEQIASMFQEDGAVSPARFKNSVHNTSGGIWSIATQNHAFTTAIAAGADTFAMSLLEAWALLVDGTPRVIVVVADEPAPPPLPADNSYPPLAVGFELAREVTGGRVYGRLSSFGIAEAPSNTDRPAIEPFREHACAPALGLLCALDEHKFGRIRVSGSQDSDWSLVLEPA